MYIKILSEMSGLHGALVTHLRIWDHRCQDDGLFCTKITIHSMKQIGTACELSVEVCKWYGGELKHYNFFNATI